MFVSHLDDIQGLEIKSDAVKNVVKQVAISPKEGWADYTMRIFSLTAGGYTPRHKHEWPHINYVISGEGTLFAGGENKPVKAGSVAYLPNGMEHQFMADCGSDLKFICIVPSSRDY